MTRRTQQEIDGLDYLALRAIADKQPDPTNRDAYDEWLLANAAIDLFHRGERRAEHEAAARKAAEDSRAERAQAKRARLSAEGVTLPACWFATGAWAKARPATAKVAATVAGLLARNGEHLPYALIVEETGLSLSTVKRALHEARDLGLLSWTPKPVPGVHPPKLACFFTVRVQP